MPIVEIPINKGVFKTENGRSLRNSEYAENLINMLIDEAGGNIDRPSLSLLTTLDSIEPIGMRFFEGVVVAVTADRKIYSIQLDGEVTDVTGDPLPGVSRPIFADNGGTLFIVGGGTPIKWEGFGTTTAALGGSPPSMSHIVFLDGYLIGNRRLDSENNKVIQFSDFEDPETWNATDIFSAVSDPDEVQAVDVSQRELYLVGEETVEVWQNVGTDPIPFARAFIWQLGTPAPYSVVSEDNSVFLLDQDRRIIRLAGRQSIRMSQAIENELSTYETVNDCWSASFTWKGSIHVIFNFPTAGTAWSIDLKNNEWTDWRGFDNGLSRVRINCLTYLKNNGAIFAGDYSTGKVWNFSDTNKTDAEGVFVRQRTFSYRDGGGSVRKRCDLFRINLERNVAAMYSGTTSETNPKIELRFKDSGRGWSDWRQFSLGERGETKAYAEFRRLGIYRSRQYEIRMTDPAALKITSIETDETVMAS